MGHVDQRESREHRKNGLLELPFVVGTAPRESTLASTDTRTAESILETGSARSTGKAPKKPERHSDAWRIILASLLVPFGP